MELEASLNRLKEHFDTSLTPEQLEEILDTATGANVSTDTNLNTDKSLKNLPLVQRVTGAAFNNVIDVLTEVCTEFRIVKESERHSQKDDSWEYLSKKINTDHLLIFENCLIELAFIDSTDVRYYQLALLAGNSYLLLITTPGAKAFGIFQPDIVQRSFNLLSTINRIGKMSGNRTDLYVKYMSLLECIEILLKNVSFEEYESLRIDLLNELANLIELNYTTAFRIPSMKIIIYYADNVCTFNVLNFRCRFNARKVL